MNSPIELSSLLVVGTVESVSPARVVAILDIEAPQSVALNTGYPRSFPKINSYVLIPNEAGAVVGSITWLGIEKSLYPKRKGLEDFGLVDLPFPMRKIHIVPIGMLQTSFKTSFKIKEYSLKRGITAFPSLGDKVILPNQEQYEAIIGEGKGHKNFEIGHAPMANNAKVRVNTNKIFGHHLAILGNTGSGKSCSMAGMIRWSLENALQYSEKENLNARFIVLDPNGEYKNVFTDFKARVFQVDPGENVRPLKVPAWLWNSDEWSIFTRAKQQAQKPFLEQSLKEMKTGYEKIDKTKEYSLYEQMKKRLNQINSKLNQGPGAYSGEYKANNETGELLEVIREEAIDYYELFSDDINVLGCLSSLSEVINEIIQKKSKTSGTRTSYIGFTRIDLCKVIKEIEQLISVLTEKGINKNVFTTEKSASSPIPFKVTELPNFIEAKASSEGNFQYILPLITRIRNMLADIRMKPIISDEKSDSLLNWLEDYIGKDQAENGNITVVDLSLVPSEITHIITSVISRVVFESVQRYRRFNNGKSLPTVIAVEEAHNFIKKIYDEESPASVCTKTFEKIAREGRKYGLGLIISSQRPYELSPTVISQCNTFLLHRIVNDHDQDLVRRLVPDNLDGLLDELPNLPSRQAILLGLATPIPVIVNIKELQEQQRPQSEDPEFFDVWIGEEERTIDWESIIQDWK